MSLSPIIGVAFWMFLACVVVAGIWYAYARNKQTQKTIRLAIEKGIHIDDAFLKKLFAKESGNPQDYYIGGYICIAVAMGLPVMGYFIGKIAMEAFYPLMGAGILVGLIGISLVLCGKLVDRRGKAVNKRDY